MARKFPLPKKYLGPSTVPEHNQTESGNTSVVVTYHVSCACLLHNQICGGMHNGQIQAQTTSRKLQSCDTILAHTAHCRPKLCRYDYDLIESSTPKTKSTPQDESQNNHRHRTNSKERREQYKTCVSERSSDGSKQQRMGGDQKDTKRNTRSIDIRI